MCKQVFDEVLLQQQVVLYTGMPSPFSTTDSDSLLYVSVREATA